MRSHGLQPTRLFHPWDFPGKSTGVGCHRLLRNSPTRETKSQPTLKTPEQSRWSDYRLSGACLSKLLCFRTKTRGIGDSKKPTLLILSLLGSHVLSCDQLFCDPMGDAMDCFLLGSSVHGLSQAKILEWVAISFFRGPSRPRTKPTSPALQADSLPLSHLGS